MESIKHLFKEVITCNIINDGNGAYSYNGVALNGTSAAFQKRLNTLYEAALIEIPFLDNEVREGFENLIDEYIKIQASFDAPNESHLKAMDEEIANGNDNPHLKQERDFVEMVCECVSLQKYYLNEFATAIGHTSTREFTSTPIEVKEEASSDDTNLKRS